MFQIHPVDLERRRARCRPVVAQLQALERESRAECNICDGSRAVLVAGADRYGFAARTVMCRRCGLIYLADRFAPGGYTEFYRGGAYRALSGEFGGRRRTIAEIQHDQMAYSAHAMNALEPHLGSRAGLQLLDVGGSTGVVAREFARRFGVDATVLDPAEGEVAEARRLGLQGVVSTLEQYDTRQRFDVVLLCRSIEHLLDLRGALARIRALLKPDGLFYCDIIDYLESCRLTGAPQTVSKMDHCYWLCQETAPEIFRGVGLEIVSADISFDPAVIGYVLRRAEPAPIHGGAHIEPMVRRLREIDADWRRYGYVPRDLAHRAHRLAYRCKRHMLRALHTAGVVVTGWHAPAVASWEFTLDTIFRQ